MFVVKFRVGNRLLEFWIYHNILFNNGNIVIRGEQFTPDPGTLRIETHDCIPVDPAGRNV